MTNKAFLALVAVVLALGASLGGAFAGGMALGKSQGEAITDTGASVPSSSDFPSRLPGQFGSERSPEEFLQLREQFSEQFGGQAGGGFRRGGGGFAGGGLTGAIEKIEGNVVTVTTSQGPLQATIVDGTAIQMFSVGALADLQPGQRVTIIGQPGEAGAVQAQSILLLPEGGGLFGGFGGGSFGQDDR